MEASKIFKGVFADTEEMGFAICEQIPFTP